MMDRGSLNKRLGKDMPVGSKHYRAFVGPPDKYDLVSSMQFALLTLIGLREQHFLLDIGCGSLRAGKLLIPYLLPERYYGIEPEQWLIDEGIRNELGNEIIRLKKPAFCNDANFTLSSFNQKFDFILAQSIFSHAPAKQIRRCLTEAKKVMKPTTIFAATFVLGKSDYAGNEWVYPGCVAYKIESFRKMVEEQGISCKKLNWPHPNGQTWIAISTKEHQSNIPEFTEIYKKTGRKSSFDKIIAALKGNRKQ